MHIYLILEERVTNKISVFVKLIINSTQIFTTRYPVRQRKNGAKYKGFVGAKAPHVAN